MRFFFYQYLVALLVLVVACNADKSVPTVDASSKDIGKTDIDNPERELDEPQIVNNATIWHSPRMLIQRLGDLEDKTVANIGAGPRGYFSFQIADQAKKVIAIDIDTNAIQYIDSMRLEYLPKALQSNLETRLVEPDDPRLRFEEADVVTIRETYAYLPNRINYLKKLKRGIKDGGQLLIVDFKMRKLPIGPPQSEKVPLYQVEQEVEEAGYKIVFVDDKSLTYQYMLLAVKE